MPQVLFGSLPAHVEYELAILATPTSKSAMTSGRQRRLTAGLPGLFAIASKPRPPSGVVRPKQKFQKMKPLDNLWNLQIRCAPK